MKGTHFVKPLELSIEIDSESWHQGESVTTNLKITNHSAEDISLENFGMSIVYADIKKLKSKTVGAFTTLEKKCFEASSHVSSKGQIELAHTFQLEGDCPITQKSASPYMLYGNLEDQHSCGMLQLNVIPQKIFLDFIEIFENFYRFKSKDKKSKNGMVDIKFVPPGSNEFAKVESLNLQTKIEGDQLKLKYMFKIQDIDLSSGTMGLAKKKRDFEQALTPKQYLLYKDSPNLDGIRAAIDEILDKVRTKTLL
ncbi:MAG: hypothetical protein HOE90_03245 [Bacteriovoracaceae bacterium]|jgi:hypothetical protein|nr:hypothetical protein [Bacteriovoracaceae bacterium]